MEVLITAGGTEEPIDGVRTITNFSTGKTGATIADIFYKKGFKVTLLTSIRAVPPKKDVNIVRFQSFNDLDRELQNLLATGRFKGVIHAAAVSDFSVDYLESGGVKFAPLTVTKLDSNRPLTITLKPNFKIIDKIKEYSPNPLLLIGFKLTKNASEDVIKKKVNSLFSSKMVDFVVQNDLTSISPKKHLSTIHRKNSVFKSCKTKVELALALVKLFKGDA